MVLGYGHTLEWRFCICSPFVLMLFQKRPRSSNRGRCYAFLGVWGSNHVKRFADEEQASDEAKSEKFHFSALTRSGFRKRGIRRFRL
jgi:hypothetical protein